MIEQPERLAADLQVGLEDEEPGALGVVPGEAAVEEPQAVVARGDAGVAAELQEGTEPELDGEEDHAEDGEDVRQPPFTLEELRDARGGGGGRRTHGSVISLCGPSGKKLISGP